LNHISILKHADQIWCWSDFTTNNLKKYGVHTAITMPPPVLIRHPEEKESILNINALALNTSRAVNANDIKTLGQVLQQHRKNTVFISVLNPFDRRKHIKMMLTAFQLALNKNPNMVLIIKLVIDNKLTTLVNIQEILDVHYDYQNVSDHIIFISETLTDSQMTSLNQIARFYLCTSSTEGLNLPMIEAMSQGVVPISTKATAMADYIHEHNAVVIKNDKTLTDGPYHLLHTHLSTTHFPPLLSSLVDSLISAADMSSDKYTDLSNQAKSDVYEKYNMDAFIKKLNSLGIKQ
jgi:glycosyltransferase involved in cell wall biosynthesis